MKPASALIEVLFAAAIASVGLLALVQVATRSVGNSSAAKQRSEANVMASRGMECVKNNKATLPWTTFSGNVGNGCTCGSAIFSCSISSSGVQVVPASPGGTKASQRVTVTVRVQWGTDSVTQLSDFYLY